MGLVSVSADSGDGVRAGTWQAAVAGLSLGALLVVAVGAEAEPGHLLRGDWNLQQRLAVGLQGPSQGLRPVVPTVEKGTPGAIRGGHREGQGRGASRGPPGLLGNRLRHRHDDGEEERQQQAVTPRRCRHLSLRRKPVFTNGSLELGHVCKSGTKTSTSQKDFNLYH